MKLGKKIEVSLGLDLEENKVSFFKRISNLLKRFFVFLGLISEPKVPEPTEHENYR